MIGPGDLTKIIGPIIIPMNIVIIQPTIPPVMSKSRFNKACRKEIGLIVVVNTLKPKTLPMLRLGNVSMSSPYKYVQ